MIKWLTSMWAAWPDLGRFALNLPDWGLRLISGGLGFGVETFGIWGLWFRVFGIPGWTPAC